MRHTHPVGHQSPENTTLCPTNSDLHHRLLKVSVLIDMTCDPNRDVLTRKEWPVVVQEDLGLSGVRRTNILWRHSAIICRGQSYVSRNRECLLLEVIFHPSTVMTGSLHGQDPWLLYSSHPEFLPLTTVMSKCVFSVWACVWQQCLQRPERGIRSSGAGLWAIMGYMMWMVGTLHAVCAFNRWAILLAPDLNFLLPETQGESKYFCFFPNG